MNELQAIDAKNLQDKIHSIRGLQMMIDRDLAELYGELGQKHLIKRSKETLRDFLVILDFNLALGKRMNWSQTLTGCKT